MLFIFTFQFYVISHEKWKSENQKGWQRFRQNFNTLMKWLSSKFFKIGSKFIYNIFNLHFFLYFEIDTIYYGTWKVVILSEGKIIFGWTLKLEITFSRFINHVMSSHAGFLFSPFVHSWNYEFWLKISFFFCSWTYRNCANFLGMADKRKIGLLAL